MEKKTNQTTLQVFKNALESCINGVQNSIAGVMSNMDINKASVAVNSTVSFGTTLLGGANFVDGNMLAGIGLLITGIGTAMMAYISILTVGEKAGYQKGAQDSIIQAANSLYPKVGEQLGLSKEEMDAVIKETLDKKLNKESDRKNTRTPKEKERER